jgi:DNA sulfur modification protein DndB
MDGFGYTFPAIRGIQAGREFYTSMCPLRLIPRIFLFDEEEAALSPQLRAQRTLNRARVPEISDYILKNRDDYIFSAITASVDATVRFEPVDVSGTSNYIGTLQIPMDAKFIINDGQHRRAAIEEALREDPSLGDDSIAVVFFLDRGLERCQQMFADLNRHAIRPSRSLGILYDQRDDLAALTRLVVFQSSFFAGLVEMERSSLSARSRKLFTLSALHHANAELLEGLELNDRDQAARLAIDYWESLAALMPEWHLVKQGKISSGEVRADFIHPHALTLQAFGQVGNQLLKKYPTQWQEKLQGVSKIDWSRSNPLWEGRAMVAGKLSKTNQAILLTSIVIKQAMGLGLSKAEERSEQNLREANDDD